MLFSRTYRYQTTVPAEDIKNRLLGNHVKVHNLDFEVFEKDRTIKIIPHAEQVEAIKTLPITHIELKGGGPKTQVVITSKMRKIDQGGPLLVVFFCTFMLLAALFSFVRGGSDYSVYTYSLLGIAVLIGMVFWMRMEAGYFDYIRKIRDYIKKQSLA